jgi:chromosome segregation ATPase
MKKQIAKNTFAVLATLLFSTALQSSEIQVSLPNPPWKPTPENCQHFRLRVNEAQAALRDQLDACYRNSSHTIAEIQPIAGCYEYATRKCRSLATQVCSLRKNMEKQVEECNAKAEIWRLTQRRIDTVQERRADQLVDRTNERLRKLRPGGSTAHELSDQITDAGINMHRNINRNGLNEFDAQLREFNQFECQNGDVRCKSDEARKRIAADPRTCRALGTCDQ